MFLIKLCSGNSNPSPSCCTIASVTEVWGDRTGRALQRLWLSTKRAILKQGAIYLSSKALKKEKQMPLLSQLASNVTHHNLELWLWKIRRWKESTWWLSEKYSGLKWSQLPQFPKMYSIFILKIPRWGGEDPLSVLRRRWTKAQGDTLGAAKWYNRAQFRDPEVKVHMGQRWKAVSCFIFSSGTC